MINPYIRKKKAIYCHQYIYVRQVTLLRVRYMRSRQDKSKEEEAKEAWGRAVAKVALLRNQKLSDGERMQLGLPVCVEGLEDPRVVVALAYAAEPVALKEATVSGGRRRRSAGESEKFWNSSKS